MCEIGGLAKNFPQRKIKNSLRKVINKLFSVCSVYVGKRIVNTSPAKFSLGRRDAVTLLLFAERAAFLQLSLKET